MTTYFLDTNDDISPIEVVIIVSERTDRPEDLLSGSTWIPTRFELDTFGFDTIAPEEAFHVDWENSAHDENTPLPVGFEPRRAQA